MATGRGGPKGDAAETAQSYRARLQELEQKAQEAYDHAVLALSGGALGVSIAFLKDIVKPGQAQDTWLAGLAWLAWCASLACTLWSHYWSTRAMRRAVEEFDAGEAKRKTRLGGLADQLTVGLNVAAGVAFIMGAVSFATFAFRNLP
jgi:hypothetical protein